MDQKSSASAPQTWPGRNKSALHHAPKPAQWGSASNPSMAGTTPAVWTGAGVLALGSMLALLLPRVERVKRTERVRPEPESAPLAPHGAIGPAPASPALARR